MSLNLFLYFKIYTIFFCVFQSKRLSAAALKGSEVGGGYLMIGQCV